MYWTHLVGRLYITEKVMILKLIPAGRHNLLYDN